MKTIFMAARDNFRSERVNVQFTLQNNFKQFEALPKYLKRLEPSKTFFVRFL